MSAGKHTKYILHLFIYTFYTLPFTGTPCEKEHFFLSHDPLTEKIIPGLRRENCHRASGNYCPERSVRR